MDKVGFECWVDVPGTGGRYQVSSFGRLRMLGRKKFLGRTMRILFEPKVKRLASDFKTGEIGWSVYLDGQERFFARDELVGLFPAAYLEVDRSRDAELRAERDEAYAEWRRRKESEREG